MKILFVDLSNSLVQKVRDIGIEAICDDYFFTGYKTVKPVFMTASNPRWTFGGGIDFSFVQHFPELCHFKKVKGGDMERIANVVFSITVDNTLKATPEQIEKALKFAIDNTGPDETLILSGIGTGIGCLSEDVLVRIINKLV